MTDATYLPGNLPRIARTEKAEELRLPAVDLVAAPVFIHDCVTPCGGETFLSLLMKRMMAKNQS